MGYVTSISVGMVMAQLAKEHRLSWSEAARRGMALMLADMGVQDYDNDLNIYRKMKQFQKLAEEANQKLSELQEKQK
jgi:hypothetical protein